MFEIFNFTAIPYFSYFQLIGYFFISKIIKQYLKKYGLTNDKETKCIIYILEIITNPFILCGYSYIDPYYINLI